MPIQEDGHLRRATYSNPWERAQAASQYKDPACQGVVAPSQRKGNYLGVRVGDV